MVAKLVPGPIADDYVLGHLNSSADAVWRFTSLLVGVGIA
jgi:hypothetical protein